MLTQPDQIDPEAAFAPPEQKDVATAITLSGGAVVMQTYIARDATLVEYNAILDKLGAAIKRQTAKTDLEEELLNLDVEETQLARLTEDFQQIEPRAEKAWAATGRKGAYKPAPQEVAQKQTAVTNIERFREAIGKRKVRIAKLKALIGTE